MQNDIISRISEIYSHIDKETEAFQNRTSLQCPPGCGKCCTSVKVEATVPEMLPLAQELFQQGEWYLWLERIAAADDERKCVFYQPDPVISVNGRCLVYPWRPTLCRLFGFAAVKNKKGLPEAVICEHQKKNMPEIAAAVKAAVPDGLPIPKFTDFSIQISSLDPCSEIRPIPINRAARLALERYGLAMQLAGSDSAGKAHIR